MITECKGKGYEERLGIMNLTSLETRRLRADLLEVFKIMKGFEGVKEDTFFTRKVDKGRGHEFSLFKKRFRLDVAKFNFGNRVINDWNRLPDSVVKAENLNTFKGGLDHYLRHIRGMR